MQTRFVPLEVTAKEAAVSIAFKYRSAVLATDAIVITDPFFMITVHIKLEYGQLAVFLLLLPLKMKPEDSFVHDTGQQENLFDFFFLGNAA